MIDLASSIDRKADCGRKAIFGVSYIFVQRDYNIPTPLRSWKGGSMNTIECKKHTDQPCNCLESLQILNEEISFVQLEILTKDQLIEQDEDIN